MGNLNKPEKKFPGLNSTAVEFTLGKKLQQFRGLNDIFGWNK